MSDHEDELRTAETNEPGEESEETTDVDQDLVDAVVEQVADAVLPDPYAGVNNEPGVTVDGKFTEVPPQNDPIDAATGKPASQLDGRDNHEDDVLAAQAEAQIPEASDGPQVEESDDDEDTETDQD